VVPTGYHGIARLVQAFYFGFAAKELIKGAKEIVPRGDQDGLRFFRPDLLVKGLDPFQASYFYFLAVNLGFKGKDLALKIRGGEEDKLFLRLKMNFPTPSQREENT